MERFDPAVFDLIDLALREDIGAGDITTESIVTGDEEYRSEDSMPQLAKILAVRHGFKCTLLFAVNPDTGEIDPGSGTAAVAIVALQRAVAVADLVIEHLVGLGLDPAHFGRRVEAHVDQPLAHRRIGIAGALLMRLGLLGNHDFVHRDLVTAPPLPVIRPA